MDRKEYLKEYKELHKEEIKEYKKSWYQRNKEKVKSRSKEYYKENTEKVKERNKFYTNFKNESDMNHSIKLNVLSHINTGIRNGWFEKRLEQMLGYSSWQLVERIESFWENNMTWGNYRTSGWHIHHVIPMKVFNFYNEEEIKKCWDLRNIYPLWNKDRHTDINWKEIDISKLNDLLPDTLLMEELT